MNLAINQISSDIASAVRTALAEDIGTGDLTAQLIPENTRATAHVITREDCVLCGREWVDETFRQVGGIDSIEWDCRDGDRVKAGTTLVHLRGLARNLLSGERTALNFLQLLSGVATKSSAFAEAARGSSLKILDTRKTIPGLRTAQKYAVAIGGCDNHRIGLYDAFLIKENHISACGSIAAAVQEARLVGPGKPVEVEVENLDELREALSCGADIIMLDNFSDDDLVAAMSLDKGKSKYEFSGNLSLEDIPRLANYTIDYLSFGSLTKHVQAIDLSFRLSNA